MRAAGKVFPPLASAMQTKPVMRVTLREMKPDDLDRLVAMYESFEPKGEFQGLPPPTTAQIREWLNRLQQPGDRHFVGESGGRLVAHCFLCGGPRPNEAELAIFVHQSVRGRGLGRKLLLGALNFGCKQLHLSRVWLTTLGSNPVAAHLFRSVGFRLRHGDEPAWELDMERPSSCARCKGKRCAVFNTALPLTVSLA